MRFERAGTCKQRKAMRDADRGCPAEAGRVSFAQGERDRIIVVRLRAVVLSPHLAVRESRGSTEVAAGRAAEHAAMAQCLLHIVCVVWRPDGVLLGVAIRWAT